LPLFFQSLSFIFNGLQPLFQKYRGGGIPIPHIEDQNDTKISQALISLPSRCQ
jgi:hypothetical protein